jgi:MraZ protein
VFVGTYPRSVDAKGRLLLPTDAVRDLDAADRAGYYLAPGTGCLMLFPRSTFGTLTRSMSQPTPFAHPVFNRAFFGRSAYRPSDSMGRILLPESLRAEAGITGEAVLVGCGDYLEIWSAERFQAAQATLPPVTELLAGMRAGEGPDTSR